MNRFVLTDAQWAKMEPFCLGKQGDPGRSGNNNRLFVEAVLWIARTGSPWRDLPRAFGHWNSVFTRFFNTGFLLHVVPGGLPTEALIAQVIVAKFGDHLPFYRQAEIYARQGVVLDRATLGDWAGRACFHLQPIVDHMSKRLAFADRVFMDETTAPVLDPGHRRTKKVSRCI